MAKVLEFSNDDSNQIILITEFYFLAKELLLFGEQIDPNNNTLTQPINELRHCLDHIMRVTASKLNLKANDKEEDYISNNLTKAYGHVYRAAYDALDWISLTIRGFVSDELIKYSNEAIVSAIPDYYSKLRPRLEAILTNDITLLRKSKDVTINNQESFETHIKVVAELKDMRDIIIKAKPALIDYESREKSRTRKKTKFRILENILVGLGVGFFVWLLTYIIIK